ncbi:mgtA regulatory leader peptide MgtL [Escherichia coli]|nr:mgtA regulatory leader peptide MgtL [Escherichia coli]
MEPDPTPLPRRRL